MRVCLHVMHVRGSRLRCDEAITITSATCFSCRPVLSDEAGRELRDFWLSLRHAGMGASGLPVTMRQLDGLVRLSEARARMELSNVVTREHALDVVDVVRSSVIGSVGCPGAAVRAAAR